MRSVNQAMRCSLLLAALIAAIGIAVSAQQQPPPWIAGVPAAGARHVRSSSNKADQTAVLASADADHRPRSRIRQSDRLVNWRGCQSPRSCRAAAAAAFALDDQGALLLDLTELLGRLRYIADWHLRKSRLSPVSSGHGACRPLQAGGVAAPAASPIGQQPRCAVDFWRLPRGCK